MPGVARKIRYRVAPPFTAYQYASMIVAPVTDFVRHDRSSTSPTAAGAAAGATAAPTVEAAGPAGAATAAAAPTVAIPNAATAAAAVFASLMLDILHRPD